jgi:hypothetical protein
MCNQVLHRRENFRIESVRIYCGEQMATPIEAWVRLPDFLSSIGCSWWWTTKMPKWPDESKINEIQVSGECTVKDCRGWVWFTNSTLVLLCTRRPRIWSKRDTIWNQADMLSKPVVRGISLPLQNIFDGHCVWASHLRFLQILGFAEPYIWILYLNIFRHIGDL